MYIKALHWSGRPLLISALAIVSACIGTVIGKDTYLRGPGSFTATYPSTAGTKLDSCGLCHTNPAGGGARNPYGTAWKNNDKSFTGIEPLDSDFDGFSNIQEINALTWPGDASDSPGPPDIKPPTVTFSIPPTSTSLTIPVAFSASDDVAVAGYFLSESGTKPAADSGGWTSSPPTSYTFASAGTKTLHAFAKDGAGNVSDGVSATTNVVLSDITPPTITTFAVPGNSSSLTVSVSLSATDDVGVTGFLLTELTVVPTAGSAGWVASAPSSYTFASAGTKILYAYAKDNAGNVSAGVSAPTTITIPIPTLTNLVAAHNRNSSRYEKDCSNCHLAVAYERSLAEPEIHTAHITMSSYVPGKSVNAKCGFCHRTVDLVERSGANVRRQVEPALCAVCHRDTRAKRFYLPASQPSGAELYRLVCSGCHGDLSKSKVLGKSATEIQKKIAENEGGMGPLGVLTSNEIQSIADALRR